MVVAARIAPDTFLDGIMRAWPATIRVFLRHRMGCVGCPVATFHTVADAAREYHVDIEVLLTELRAAASIPRDTDEGMGIAHDDPPADPNQDA